jgi:hypothetical protein
MKSIALAFVFLLGISTGASADEKLEGIKQKSQKEAAEFMKSVLGNKAWNKAVMDALKAANAKYSAGANRTDKTPVEGIDGKDKIWTEWFKAHKLAKSKNEKAPDMPPLVSEVMKNACSDALRAAKAKDKAVSEVFIMDRLGASVCAADPTSDYDQGDEDKWLDPWVNGVNPQIGSPTRDASADNFQTQVSFVIEDGGKKVGVITIGTLVN